MAQDYILVYRINDYPEMGGGTYCETFPELEDMDAFVDKLLLEKKELLIIEIAAEIRKRFNYVPVEVVKKLEREEL